MFVFFFTGDVKSIYIAIVQLYVISCGYKPIKKDDYLQSKDPVSISTTPVTLCWNTSLNVTIHLSESTALPTLNVK